MASAFRWLTAGLMVGAVGTAACGGGGSDPVPAGTGGSSGTSDAGAETSHVGGGGVDGSAPVESGSSGAAGAPADEAGAGPDAAASGDAAVVMPSPSGMDLVGAAIIARSANFKAILTLGESPGGNGISKSPLYQLHGGLISSSER